jgi:Coenzyme PQQ synthesis protein D (PqqD)
MAAADPRLPQARTDNLLFRDLPGGELLVYDTDRHQAHTLNHSAALVWRHCDGQTAVATMAAQLKVELGLPAEEELVQLALSRLQQAHLLQGAVSSPPTGVSRRAVMRKLGIVGSLAALVPLVASLAAPAAAEVSSPVGIPY